MRRIASLFTMLAFALGFASNAQALIMHEPSVTPESAYIEYAEMFPSVGWIFVQEGGADVAFASGVLIDKN